MCNCIKQLNTELIFQFPNDIELMKNLVTAALPNGRTEGIDFSQRILLQVKLRPGKKFYVPAFFCPFCGEKYNPNDTPGVKESISYVIRKSGEIWRLEK